MREKLNQLEPESLVANFLRYPPQGFEVDDSLEGMPSFRMNFDLLTADSDVKRRINALPLASWWYESLLVRRTCFIGSTVTEYTAFPASVFPGRLVIDIKRTLGRACSLLIVRDIPLNSPLLDTVANKYAEDFVNVAERENFVIVSGQALAYVPINFTSIDEFLLRFSANRRRDFRRKLRVRSELSIESLQTGDVLFSDDAVLQEFYALYLNVFRQSEIHFDLLSLDFFRAVLCASGDNGVVFIYRYRHELIGFNICYVSHGCLVDKFIGLAYPKSKLFNLYFVSWFHNLEFAISQGLHTYVAGWTDPDVKARLGAEFTLTRHAVYARSGLLRYFIKQFVSRFMQPERGHGTGE